MWEEFYKLYFITITSGLLYLTLIVTSDPVCYTRKDLDENNRLVTLADCDGTDKICKRFASSEEVNWVDILSTTCAYPNDYQFPPEGSAQEMDFQGDPVCYTRKNLDERNILFKMADCKGTDKICKRFASSEEVNWVNLLNTPCDYPNDYLLPPEGSTTEKDFQAITCQKVDLPTVTDGFFNCSGYSVGDKCNLTCDDGYYPVSSNETVCEENVDFEANWSVGTFQCSAITCREVDLPTVKDGFFNCSGYSFGDKCNLTCDDGYYPVSSNETVCEENVDFEANWSVGTFQCSAITCREVDLPAVKAGFFNCSGYSVGDKCNLTCDDGYYPVSSNETVCEENVVFDANWSVGTFQCSAIRCREVDLPAVKAGFFNCSGYSVGEKCNLTCDDGYYPASSNETVCEENAYLHGNWSVGTFECSAIICSTTNLPTVTGGSFDCQSDVSEGEACTLTCNNGFYPTSSTLIVCEAGTANQGVEWSNRSFVCHGCNKWYEWSGIQYKFISTEQTWEESRQLCKSDSAHLVTIENEKENDFVQKVAWHCDNNAPWIGLNDLVREGKWRWSDGTIVTYRNWGEGQPNSQINDCAFIRRDSGEWNDYSCNDDRNTVCKRKYLIK